MLRPKVFHYSVVAILLVTSVLFIQAYATQLRELVADHAGLGIVVFLISSVLAVLLPLLTNLPLIPIAAVTYGEGLTATLLLLGWTTGSAMAFSLGRYLRAATLRQFPSANQYADIDRLIHPKHRLWSLVLLRMTFPVDILSYSLGIFSRTTTLHETILSTALGAAPFAVLFAFFPTLSTTTQLSFIVLSVIAFAIYAWWAWDAQPKK